MTRITRMRGSRIATPSTGIRKTRTQAYSGVVKPIDCFHRVLHVHTELDGCTWIVCNHCKMTGPAKHSRLAAICAFELKRMNQHPRA